MDVVYFKQNKVITDAFTLLTVSTCPRLNRHHYHPDSRISSPNLHAPLSTAQTIIRPQVSTMTTCGVPSKEQHMSQHQQHVHKGRWLLLQET